jgi:thiamine-phosphate pyrophosphorylase
MIAVLPRPLVAAVSNRRLLSERDDEACEQLVEWSAAIGRADVDILQIRERGLDDGSLARLVCHVLGATAGTRVRVLVNERTDIALATGAAGVHLPSSAPAAATVRRIAPTGFLIGRSVHAGDDVAALERAGGCDYLTFGTVFSSTSKPADHRPAGVGELRRVCAATSLPVLAIGGVTVTLAAQAAGAGAAGVAAIGLFLDPWRPERSSPGVARGDNEGGAARLASTVAALRAACTSATREG